MGRTPSDDDTHRLANAEPATVPDDADRDENGDPVFPDAELGAGDTIRDRLLFFPWQTSFDYNDCPGCTAERGDLHDRGCDHERCPECGEQLIGCEHAENYKV